MEREDIFANHKPDKEFISKIIDKQFISLEITNRTQLFFEFLQLNTTQQQKKKNTQKNQTKQQKAN